ncbi:insulinase family protein [Paracrocinitomix mangrovi]|uniref:M16 family metallopeptidase n=1 Tax=Paracrocinitomix mangrovi TaxID=2862509 RepID=UPI001C8E2FC2|nr:pitrilysin family protein [Paracrocinitomix mangrovi]UKN01737.1 insulinase family protein [Paracrocinitomix mangrovi]
MKLRNWLIGALIFATTGVSAQERRKIDFEEYDLDNGMHVILHEDHSTPIVAVTVLYHVGSKNEKVGRTGFAHFFEHLMFEGTTNIDRHTYDKHVERAGGTLNANTSQDRTFYFELLPSNQLEMGLWLESERMLHAKVENVGIETQREVVKEEKRQRVDNQPYGSFMEEVFKRAYKDHPYKWVPIGSMEDLDAAQEEDYVNFYRTFYVPHNATLSIAGDIDPKQAKKWIDKYFGSIPNGDKLDVYRDKEFLSLEDFQKKYAETLRGREISKDFVGDWHNKLGTEEFIAKYFGGISTKPHDIPRPTIKEGLLEKEIRDTVYDNIQLPAIIVAYRVPELRHKDKYALDMLSMILSQGNSSRFNKNIVEKKQQALAAFAFPFGLEDPGIMLSLAIANQDVKLEDLEASMDEEVADIQNNLITDEEFEKLQNMIESDFVSSNSTMAGIAESLANNHVYLGSTNMINKEIDEYMKVTKADIQRVAKKYLAPTNRVILYYLPKSA